MTITGIHHIKITIPTGCEDTARAFYCDRLGLPEVEKPENLKARGGFWVQVGPQQVHIGTEDGIDRHGTSAHVAYQVDDLAIWRFRLADMSLKESIPLPGFDRFEIRDPFGNRVEFIQPK